MRESGREFDRRRRLCCRKDGNRFVPCYYLMHDNTCDYAQLAGVSKLTRRAEGFCITPPDCELYQAAGKVSHIVRPVLSKATRYEFVFPDDGRFSVNYALIAALYKEGLSDAQIARGAGCGRDSVRNWRKRNGFLPNTKKGRRSAHELA